MLVQANLLKYTKSFPSENIVNKTNYLEQIQYSLQNQNNKKEHRFWSDMTKTKTDFNHNKFISTELGIKKTYDYLKKNMKINQQ